MVEYESLTYIIRSNNALDFQGQGFQGQGYVKGTDLTITASNSGIVRVGDNVVMNNVSTVTPSWATNDEGAHCFAITSYNGYLYEVNYANNSIIKINANDPSDRSVWFNVVGVLGLCQSITYYDDFFYLSNLSGSKITRIKADDPTLYDSSWVSGLSVPIGIAGYNGYVYVIVSGSNLIIKINTTTLEKSDFLIIPGNTLQYILYYNGFLYVTATNKIIKVDANNGTFTDNWATITQGVGGYPQGIVGYGDYLYVTSADAGRITAINITNPTSQYIYTWWGNGNTLRGMTIYNNAIYVSDTYFNTITKIPLTASKQTFTVTSLGTYTSVEGATGTLTISNTTSNSISPPATYLSNIVTNDCNIKLTGLPSRYNSFLCEVVAFMISAKTGDTNSNVVELRQEGMQFDGGKDNGNKGFKTVAICHLNDSHSQSTYSFTCSNFNNKTIRFQLFNEYGSLLLNNTNGNFAKPWVLILKMKPLP